MRRWLHALTGLPLLALGCVAADIGDGDDPGLEEIEFQADNGIFLENGLKLPNGIELPNGVLLHNGLDLANGIDLPNGIDLANGIAYMPPAGSGLEQWIDVDPPMHKKTLRYLIECALPAGVEVELSYRGTLEILGRGIAGLGPSLQSGVMNQIDQERVSACMLARINGMGQTVQIDMFGPMGSGSGFDTTVAADAAFPVLEAAFFGNLFTTTPEAHACQEQAYPLQRMRSCKDLGGGAYNCGVVAFEDAMCRGSDEPIVQCYHEFTTGDSARPFYQNCVGGGKRWSYVLTTYVALKQLGGSCVMSDECASGICASGACVEEQFANGEACTSRLDCASNVCEQGVCGEPAGWRCYSNSECASNTCSAKKRVCL